MISIVIPAYNESGNIARLTSRLKDQISGKEPFELIYVDDGSSDGTLEEIKEIAGKETFIKFISFSRNFGHQKALKAGLDHARGDCVITMDADMQHPPEIIGQLVEKWREGYEVVYTIRRESSETAIKKKLTSALFYRVLNGMCDIEVPLGAADFRLLDRKVVEELRKCQENWLFLRGLVSWLGFRQVGIPYTAQPRFSGKTKYSFSKMMGFAIQGITSFSILPLRLSIFFGTLSSLVAFVYALYAAYIRLFTNATIQGWTSLLISILFLGGVQLISLGVLGEYLGKMFIEAKRRPLYIIKECSL